MFKRGIQYKRDEIASIVRPNDPPSGGNWTTGYARIENDLFIFMNMGIPGRTGHDFDNHYDPKTGSLIWFGKPNSHSSQDTFKKLMNGGLRPLFFARWKQGDPFTFLGTGLIVSFEDDFVTRQGHKCIKLIISIEDIRDIVSESTDISGDIGEQVENEVHQSSFMFEKHLEDFIVTNWRQLPFGNQYDILETDGMLVGQQYRTETGPIDILSVNKNQTDFLVIELKRDRASDVVVGQTLRYMGWVKEHLCTQQQDVNGCIIAHAQDKKLEYALKQVPSIRFLKYEVDFKLVG